MFSSPSLLRILILFALSSLQSPPGSPLPPLFISAYHASFVSARLFPRISGPLAGLSALGELRALKALRFLRFLLSQASAVGHGLLLAWRDKCTN